MNIRPIMHTETSGAGDASTSRHLATDLMRGGYMDIVIQRVPAALHPSCIAPPYIPGVPPCPGQGVMPSPIPIHPPFVPVLPVEPYTNRGAA